jgi:hypothetical protein
MDPDAGVDSLVVRNYDGDDVAHIGAGCVRPGRRVGNGGDWGWLCYPCDQRHKEGARTEWFSADTFQTPEAALANLISHRKCTHAGDNEQGGSVGSSARLTRNVVDAGGEP